MVVEGGGGGVLYNLSVLPVLSKGGRAKLGGSNEHIGVYCLSVLCMILDCTYVP